MLFTEKEIYKKVKEADSRAAMVKIQAELNNCSTRDIESIIKKFEDEDVQKDMNLGLEIKNLATGRSRINYTPELIKSLEDCILKGMSLKETKEALGITIVHSGFNQQFYKIKKHLKGRIAEQDIKASPSKVEVTDRKDKESLKMSNVVDKALKSNGVLTSGGSSKLISLGDDTRPEHIEDLNKSKEVDDKVTERFEKVMESHFEKVVNESKSTKEKVEEPKTIDVKESKPKKKEKEVEQKPIDIKEVSLDKKKDSVKDIVKSTTSLSDIEDLLTIIRAKRDSIEAVIHTKNTEIEMLEATLKSYNSLISDLKFVAKETKGVLDC